MDVLQKASKFASQMDGVEATTVLDAGVNPVLAAAEEVASREVVRTWAELCEWAQQKRFGLSWLSASHVAQRLLARKAKSRVLPALGFMRKHLHLASDLDFAKAFCVARSAGIGHGAKQVHAAQHVLLMW